MNELLIDPSTSKDITALARIHHTALPDDFLPSLGRDFLENVYYPAALKSGNAITLAARARGEPVGFVTIAHYSSQYTRDVLRWAWIRMGLYALKAFLSHPSILWKSLEVLQSALFSKPDPIQSEIVFIAVDPSCHGQGIGTQLVISSLQYLERKSIYECRTKTLAGNRHVIRMYEKIGWHVRDRFRLIGNSYVNIVLENKNV